MPPFFTAAACLSAAIALGALGARQANAKLAAASRESTEAAPATKPTAQSNVAQSLRDLSRPQ